MEFNTTVKNITPSASMSKGLSEVPVFANLAVGSPDIVPPNEILDLSKRFSETPNYAYTPSKGSVKALTNLHKLVFSENPNINPTINLSLCSGAKFGIYLSLKTITNPNDHVMLMQPYWLSYPDICLSLGLRWSGFEYDFTENSYNLELLKQALLDQKSKVLLINNPNNPSGQILSKAFLQELISFCEKQNIWLLLDEVYKELIFENQGQIHEWISSENVLRVGSLSKGISIPGMRLAYVQGNKAFIHNFNLFNQHISTCVNSFALYLMENLSKASFESYTATCAATYHARYQLAHSLLTNKGFEVMPSEAAFYLMVKVTPNYASATDCINALEKKGIIVTQGESYGKQFKDYIRVCLTISEEKLRETLNQF